MVDFISSLLLVRFQQNVEVHGGSHLREASIKANHDEPQSHAAKSHALSHKVCKEQKKTNVKNEKNHQRYTRFGGKQRKRSLYETIR